MNELKAPSLQSLLESDRGSTDSLLAESLLLDFEDLDDAEYSIPALDTLPTLESVLSELEGDSDIGSEAPFAAPTPTPSTNEDGARGGSILRHVILQGISSQISSAADRVGAGLATALAVSQSIAVGTSHGHILHFDSTQALRWAHQDRNSQGAVSTVEYNDDCSRLLAGFARGLIIMIDTKTGNIIRSLFDAITPNTGVLSVKWAGRPALALASDSGGSVWSLSFTRKLGIRGYASRCLFSGARGEVCCMEPLILYDEEHELKPFSVVALATLSKYFVVIIKPRLKVIKFHILSGPPECLPILAWQMVLIQAADTSRTIDPVLAVARGNQLYFHQILVSSGRVTLLFLRHIQLSVNLLSLHWLGPKCLGYIDTSEMLHLVDVRSSKEQECIDMANAGLVYSSAQFKGLATGGNVSPALALAGTRACYSSVICKGTQLYVLGARSLHMVSIRSWSERITYLVNNQRWTDACELAIDGYRIAGDRLRRKNQAKDRIIELFNEYLSISNRAPEFCLGSIMKCLIEINELDLLWQKLWDRLDSHSLFLTILTEHIENDEVTKVSPSIAQALVEFWNNLSPAKLEDIILKLNWTCLDLHQVLTTAKKKKLYRAQIYLNTNALGDYTVSLTELIPIIESEDRNLGNCLLVYISSCLAGRGYPTGDIPLERVQSVKHEVLRCVTSIHSSNNPDGELPYPYLRALLKFDTRETLNVISLAFQEKEFSGELGVSHRQLIVNILLDIMTPDNATWSQIGCLLNFISQQMSSKCFPEDPTLLEKVVNYLYMPYIEGETPRLHAEREQAWLELLLAQCLKHIPEEQQYLRAKEAKCYSVVEYLLEKMEKYGEIINCYVNNPLRHSEMFNYIENFAKTPDRKIFPQIFENFSYLLSIDAERLTKIITYNYTDQLDELISTLKNEPKMLYLFLSNLIKFGISLNSNYCETYLELMCQENPDNVEEFLSTNDNYRLEKALEIVAKYQLQSSCVYLYEKQGDYQSAFNMSLDMLREAPESTAESSALQVSALCSRASIILSEEQRQEFWFSLLKLVLSRPDLASITRSMLHSASQHVDLSKLVQLVLSSGTQSGSFGDIKHLLIGMLSNSRYETLLMETTARVLGQDLHEQFAKKRRISNRGLWITFIKCVVCRQRLYNQTDVVVFGVCGHCLHESCSQDINKTDEIVCPRCGIEVKEWSTVRLSQPSTEVFGDEILHSTSLQLKAPPRKF